MLERTVVEITPLAAMTFTVPWIMDEAPADLCAKVRDGMPTPIRLANRWVPAAPLPPPGRRRDGGAPVMSNPVMSNPVMSVPVTSGVSIARRARRAHPRRHRRAHLAVHHHRVRIADLRIGSRHLARHALPWHDRWHGRRRHRPDVPTEGRARSPQPEGRPVVLVPRRLEQPHHPRHRGDPGAGHRPRIATSSPPAPATSNRRPTASPTRSPASRTSCCAGWTGTGPACGSRSRRSGSAGGTTATSRWRPRLDRTGRHRRPAVRSATDRPRSRFVDSERPFRLASTVGRGDRAARVARVDDGRCRRLAVAVTDHDRYTDRRRLRRRRAGGRRDRRRSGIPVVPHPPRGVRRPGEHRPRG